MRAGAWTMMVAAVFGSYGSAMTSGFVWDDHAVIEKGRLIGSLRNVPALFAHDTMWNSDGGDFGRRAAIDTYRPLTLTTFAIERSVFGIRPAAFHFDSVLVHALVVMLVFRLGLLLGFSRRVAAAGALLFAVHPSISEAVHWINGRSDPLATLFFLWGVVVWWPLLEQDGGGLRWPRALAVAVLALAASLSKETAFLLVAGLPLVVLHRRTGLGRGLATLTATLTATLAPWAAGLGVGLGLRLWALGRPAVAGGGYHLAHAAPRVPLVWRDAIVSLLSPAPRMVSSLHQPYVVVTAGGMAVALLVLGTLIVGAVLAWRRRQLLGPWALATTLLTLAPIALLTQSEGWAGWGRYLYPAAPLVCLTLSHLVLGIVLPRTGAGLRRPLEGLALLGLVLCAAQTFAAGRQWRDDESLARAWIADAPDSAAGYRALADVYYERGRLDLSLGFMLKAVSLAPRTAELWARLAMIEAAMGKHPEAWEHAQRAVGMEPHNRLGRYISCLGLLHQDRQAEAAEQLVALIAEDPDPAGLWNTLREAWAHTGPGSAFRQTAKQMARQPRFQIVSRGLPPD